MEKVFSGSYDPQDVRFLLKPVHMEYLSVEEKERRIQSGQSHYSEMLSAEHLPSPRYRELFTQAMERNAGRFARDIWHLATMIAQERRKDRRITLVSLARAGTPVGVLLRRSLALMGKEVRHYSISIIRDRGIDQTALCHMLEQDGVAPESIVFVDGWTGKGIIGAELKKAVTVFNHAIGCMVSSRLHVVADLCGVADVSATGEDYLMPSSLLNAIISGLISRSVLNNEVVGPCDFHACVYYEHWQAEDRSRWFVDTIFSEIRALSSQPLALPLAPSPAELLERQGRSARFLRYCQQAFGVKNVHHVKPGIGEATRVLLRRVPHVLLLRQEDHADTRHLSVLAQEKAVPVRLVPDLPYAAAALICNIYES